MKTIEDKLFALGIVIVGPFAIGAAIEFLPTWVSVPTTLLVTIFWLGTMIQIGEYAKSDDKDKNI